MRGTRSWAARCFVVIALTISLPASAHLVFTYTSNELPLTAYSVNGYPDDLKDYKDISPILFSYSFTVPEQDLSLQPSTTFRFKDFTFAVTYPNGDDLLYFPLDFFSSRSGGWVTLDQSGNITDWNVMLRMTELVTPETNPLFHRLSNNFIAVKSSSEDGDKLSNRFHPSTWHGYYIQLAKIQMSYSGLSNFSNWTIERVAGKVAVSESGSAGLLLIGLIGLWRMRRMANRNPVGNYVA